MACGATRPNRSARLKTAQLPSPNWIPKRVGVWLLSLCLIALSAKAIARDSENLPLAENLATEADQGKPLLILFSRKDCHWCRRARLYLRPLAEEGESAQAAVYRQIDLDSSRPITDFHGEATTARAFAAKEKIRLTPTLIFYGADGARLSKPLAGMGPEEFYSAVVLGRLNEARRTLNLPELGGTKP